jgi:hypothetical protein
MDGTFNGVTLDKSYFDSFLYGLYVTKDNLTPSIVDGVLFNLLRALKMLLKEDATNTKLIFFDFDGYEPTQFLYNNFAYGSAHLHLLNWDAATGGGYDAAANITDAMIEDHKALIYSLMTRRFRFYILNNSTTQTYEFKGPFASMYGLDPSQKLFIKPKTVVSGVTTYDYQTCELPYGDTITSLWLRI